MDEKMITNCFIDTSYVVYYTLFSTWRWMKTEFDIDESELPEDFDPVLDGQYKDEFKAEFEERFYSNVFGVIQENTVFTDPSKIYFCLDCTRKDIWRMEIYPEYKQNRNKKSSKISTSGGFSFAMDKVIPSYVEEGYKVIPKVYGAEGDDIIAVTVDYESRKGNTRNLIITSDTDMYQLADRADIYRCNGDAMTLSDVLKHYNVTPELKTITPREYIILKSFSGDKADNIPGIHARCGPKTAQKYFADKSLLEAKKSKDEMIEKTQKKNQELMDFEFIPKDLREIIEEEYETVRG